ncbi:MAG: hypothetical protein M1826_000632 [Phylliscum demangeonii]|nr:MAG: hypothetical protein M1826_000632 [Phylliscum demangeonii]
MQPARRRSSFEVAVHIPPAFARDSYLTIACDDDDSDDASGADSAKRPKKPHDLRQKRKINYVDFGESDGEVTDFGSAFASPLKATSTRPNTRSNMERAGMLPPERRSLTGYSLRPQAALRSSVKDDEIIMIQPRKSYKPKSGSKRKVKRGSIVQSDRSYSGPPPILTSRQAIRHTIATETAAKRARFLIAQKDLFLPLLPEHNYVQKLVDRKRAEQHRAGLRAEQRDEDSSKSIALASTSSDEDGVSPYVLIERQPEGIKATMKPYQLSGLSFLLYLQRNGLSGILGDEMGLGKTLQTLSLFQYLKEHNASAIKETRPFLVVCPLSVLSSWMAEARRWAPGLRVLRFHGPAEERNRLKKMAEGVADQYGNSLARPAKRQKKYRTETGKAVISLDSESDKEVEEDQDASAGYDVVVTTYETFQTEQNWFKRAFVWRYVVLDEGHKIKNDMSLVAMALQGLQAEYRLILTGTPLQNNLTELWALLHWLYPEVFTEVTSELFRESFDLTRGRINTSFMDNARRLLELVMLRRMKNSASVNLNLPPKHEVLLFVPLTPMQRFWYTRLLTRTDQGLLEDLFQGAKVKEIKTREEAMKDDERVLADREHGPDVVESGEVDGWAESREIMKKTMEQDQLSVKTSAWQKLMNLVMQLRKCCNHPYLLPNAEPNPYFYGDHIIRASGKFIVLEKLVDELVIRQGEKVLFFSGFTKMLDMCEELLQLKGGDGDAFRYVRLDGSTGRARRNLNIRLFNTVPDYKVMLISTRAGGLGINLAAATKVVMLDQDWNPQVGLQAEARAHRLGQTKPVTVYKLCSQGTVEEQMMGRIQKKLYLSAKVTEAIRDIHSSGSGSGSGTQSDANVSEEMPQLGASELMTLVRRGAQALSRPDIDMDEMLGWDWDTMLRECKDKAMDVTMAPEPPSADAAASRAQEEQQWLSGMEKVESYLFNGKKYLRKERRDERAAEPADLVRADRRVGKNVTVMVDGFAVNKESMLCEDWEAVPTLAGKDPRLAVPKREKKRAMVNQDHCQVCWEGGEIICCSGCPRAYHYTCLDKDDKGKTKRGTYYCCQHQCFDCGEKTTNVGGMIFRCRWCERGFCEDCLEWDQAEFVGDCLPEFTVLGFPIITQACYIVCPGCTEQQAQHATAKDFCRKMTAEYDGNLERFRAKMLQEEAMALEMEQSTKEEDHHDHHHRDESELPPSTEDGGQGSLDDEWKEEWPSQAESMTDAATVQESGVSTPAPGLMDGLRAFSKTVSSLL